MNDRMTKVAVGKTGVKAIQLVCMEYLNYLIEHSVIYETIQCVNWYGSEETNSIFNDYPSLLITLIFSCDLQQNKTTEILNTLTGIIHGYSSLQLRYAFSNPDILRKEFCEDIDTLFIDVFHKYKE